MEKIGVIKEIWIFPVKSMAGMSVDAADLYWYGFGGDRRYAFVQAGHTGTFPWLTAREVPTLVQYKPSFGDNAPTEWHQSPVHIETPAGDRFKITESQLVDDLNGRWAKPIRLIQQNRGSYDAAPISIMSTSTVSRLDQFYTGQLDYRRFRQNIIVEAVEDKAYIEDRWENRTIQFGTGEESPQILLHRPVERCVMINVDPDSAEKDAGVLSAVNRSRNNCVGMYAWPRRIGTVRVGETLYLPYSES